MHKIEAHSIIDNIIAPDKLSMIIIIVNLAVWNLCGSKIRNVKIDLKQKEIIANINYPVSFQYISSFSIEKSNN